MRGMGNMQGMMKKMQKMQKEMDQAQERLNEREFKGVANDDLVVVTMTGDKQIKSIEIKEEIVDPEDKELIEDLVMIAVNNVIQEIESESDRILGKYTQGLPGF